MIELGRFDIITNMSLMSSHVALPREGHLDAAVHAMAHVGQRYDSRLVYNPSYSAIDDNVFKKEVRRLISAFLWIVIMHSEA